MEFNVKIKTRREQLGFTQTEVANHLYVTRQTISKWELGKSYPDLELLIALSDFYDLSLDDLLKGDQKLIQFFKEDSYKTNKQQLISSLTTLGVWMFFLFLVITTWTSQPFLDMNIVQKIALIIAMISNSSFFLFFLIQTIQILLHKEKKHIREQKKKSNTYKLTNKINIFSLLGTIIMLIVLWCLRYDSINPYMLIIIFLFGFGITAYSSWLSTKIKKSK